MVLCWENTGLLVVSATNESVAICIAGMVQYLFSEERFYQSVYIASPDLWQLALGTRGQNEFPLLGGFIQL